MQDAQRVSEDAIDKLVTAWADALALLMPRAALRPADAIDVVFGVAEQMLGMQRLFIDELIGVAGRYSGAEAYGRGDNTNGNGRNGRPEEGARGDRWDTAHDGGYRARRSTRASLVV